MKPQQKVVTAQDIESSLYYVHVDSEEDVELLRSEGAEDGGLPEQYGKDAGSCTAQVGKDIISRKPVLPPRRPTEELKNGPQTHSLLQPLSHITKKGATLGRKPVGQGSSSPNPERTGIGSTFAHRKVLGPRPMYDRLPPLGNTALGDVPERQNIDTWRWSEQPVSSRPQLPPRPYEQKSRDLDDSYRANLTFANESLHSIEDGRSRLSGESYDGLPGQRPARESSLTLIRRYDCLQSNIGKILASDLPGDPLMLELMGSGYFKFNADKDGSKKITSLEEQEQAVYKCQLHTITSLNRPNHGLRSESHDSQIAHRSGLKGSLDLRRRSHVSSNGFEPIPHPKPAFSKGYTFQSPWNGTCSFATGVAGRSLRCLHSHPASYGQAIEISELRFNLPSSKAFAAAPKSLTPGSPRESKRSSFFSNSHRRQDSFGSMENSSARTKGDLEDRLDLSLGQEHAGGGFGGKQAKLGKLIIEQDGLQMLDLVVAANMALWWRVYDRMV